MKNIKLLFIIICICFFLVGCGCNNKKDDEEKNKELTQTEKTINNLYTDEDKLVYDNNGIYKIVYYYSGEEITGLEHYYEYKDEKEAETKYNEDMKKYKDNISIKEITRSGKYVVYTMAGEEYEGTTVKEVKESHSFLIPVYEK